VQYTPTSATQTTRQHQRRSQLARGDQDRSLALITIILAPICRQLMKSKRALGPLSPHAPHAPHQFMSSHLPQTYHHHEVPRHCRDFVPCPRPHLHLHRSQIQYQLINTLACVCCHQGTKLEIDLVLQETYDRVLNDPAILRNTAALRAAAWHILGEGGGCCGEV
jgi:hypothetical protein